MRSKILPLKKPANRKSWGQTLNILSQVSHNRMAMSNKNSLFPSTKFAQCSMVEKSMIFYKMAYQLKPQTLPHFFKTIF